MKRFLFLLLIVSAASGQAQPGNTTGKKQELRKLVFDDSALKKLQQLKDSAANAIQIQENISRNMDGFLRSQKEQNAKRKKSAIIRICIGVGLLAVLITGLMRKRKK